MHTVGDATSSVPAFLGKLWKLVEDPSTNHLISWNSNGMSFTIRDQARFARELLPLYYKHNNMASFVRQLNMYGFHKVVSVDSGGLKVDKDEMEFAHMYFLQGQEFLLEHIKRKIPISKQEETKHTKPEVLSRVLADVRSMKGKQENVDSRLNTMKRENEALWREVASLRQKHMKQQQIVNKLIQFLISIVQPNGRAGLGLKRRYPLMLGEAVRSTTNSSTTEKDLEDSAVSGNPNVSDIPSPKGPIIHDVTDIDESSCADLIGNCNELDADQMDEITEVVPNEKSPEIFFPMAQISELPISVESTEHEEEVPAEEAVEDGLGVENPDFNTMVQMEAGTSNSGSGILESSAMASPMSPDLLMAVDPREVNSGALLSFEENRKEKGGRGKSVVKNQERSVASTESNVLESREELDNHLDTMQVDLEQLREVLSLQGNPLDASTLLGVCDSLGLNFEPTLDSCNWAGYSATWNRRGIPSDSSPSLASLLEHQMLPKLFSADDTLPSNGYLSMDMDMFKNPSQGAILGNEVIAYNDASFFDMVDDYGDGQMAGDRTTRDLEDDSIVKDTTDLFDLLDDPPQPTTAIPPTTVSAAKKKKRN
ncbi:heat shock factor protein isoform X3 [Daphnia magna]|uniref:HEAT shock factor protein n=1 Tax=Daphnia magna TaxID=35525 RepID=A0A0P5TXH9_9CRUS|nr:heat shock factor protein isoform X3 [Daphnia magna]KZS12810.1 HEAT shock factor protein [Daphnia magna]